MVDELRLAASLLASAVVAASLLPLVIRLAVRTGFLDRPAGYKGHDRATPYLGGVAVVTAFVVSAAAFGDGFGDHLWLVLGALVLLAVGTLDDRIGLGPGTRVVVEVAAGAALWASGAGWSVLGTDFANLLLTIVWVVGVVNAFNLMDNMDGAASTVAAVSCAGVAVVAAKGGDVVLAALMLALSGACVGFLPYNLARPSRVFLGDGGSMPVGFVVAAAVMAVPFDGTLAWTALLAAAPLVGLPILDTTLVVVSRTRRGVQVLAGGRDHLTHRLRSRLDCPRRVASTLALAQAALCLVAIALLDASPGPVVAAAVAYIACGGAAIYLLDLPWREARVAAAAAPAVLPEAPPIWRPRLWPLPLARAATVSEDRPLRVLRVIARLNMGGPAHHVSLLSGRLDRRDYDTLLLHGSVGSGEASLQDVAERHGATVATVRGLRPELLPVDDARALMALTRRVREFRPDIVHTHTAKAGMLGRLAARLAAPRAVVIHTYHGHVLEGYFGAAKTWLYRTLERRLARTSDVLVGVSQATVDDLVRLGVAPRSKFRVIPIGLDLDPFLTVGEQERRRFRDECRVERDELLLTFVGRLVPIKRVDVALRAVACCRADGLPVRLAVVGDGELRAQLEALARELGIADAVAFLGYRADTATVAAGSDMAILSSDNEGTPVSLIEAAAAGRPAVATAVGGVADVVTPQTGALVPRGDPEALAAAITRLARDPEARAAMGQAARRHVRERFSVTRLLADIDALYAELARGASAREPRRPHVLVHKPDLRVSRRRGPTPRADVPRSRRFGRTPGRVPPTQRVPADPR